MTVNHGEDSAKRWLKAEFHAHCSLDPDDFRMCRHTPEQLISRSAALGYEILAITCHNLDIWTEALSAYARSLGITLIPGMEVTAEKSRHILAYNFRTRSENLDTLKKIRARAGEDTLVIAPHAFFPDRTCLRDLLGRNLDVFDAIEYSGFQVSGLNFNRRSARLAGETGKPLVGSGDVHFLWQLGRTFTWVYAEPDVQSVVSAVKQGLVRVESSPLSWFEAATWWATAIWRNAVPGNPAASDEIKNRGRLGTAQESMKS
ncbi:MAG TPA: PHP-associated domain-containing protein [Acidobacteriota bacterium]|nr:PHP-associated domain-containing protein [Acidobacteriota bacterium]